MTGNDRKDNLEKYNKERNREINQMADAEQKEQLHQSKDEESEGDENSDTGESSSSEETFEINCIGEEDNDRDTDVIAVTNETVAFKKPKTKTKIEKDPNIYEGQRRKNAIELELRGNLQYNNFQRSNNFQKLSLTGILDSGNSCWKSAVSGEFFRRLKCGGFLENAKYFYSDVKITGANKKQFNVSKIVKKGFDFIQK